MYFCVPPRRRGDFSKRANESNHKIQMFCRNVGFERQRRATARRSPDPTRRRSQMRPYVPGAVVDLHFRRVGRQSAVLTAPPDAQKQTNVPYIYFPATQTGTVLITFSIDLLHSHQ